ncbi:MAG: hypothetical protein WC423_22490 [Vulcanimicrobiota bacterium]
MNIEVSDSTVLNKVLAVGLPVSLKFTRVNFLDTAFTAPAFLGQFHLTDCVFPEAGAFTFPGPGCLRADGCTFGNVTLFGYVNDLDNFEVNNTIKGTFDDFASDGCP